MDNKINMDILNRILIPLFITVLGGLIVLILWRKNISKQERTKLYQPLLNELAKTISELPDLIEKNYPPAILKNKTNDVVSKYRSRNEFINLPSALKNKIFTFLEINTEYKQLLSKLLNKIAPLESYVEHRPYKEPIKQYYIIDFILLDEPPNNDVVLNFPQKPAGAFHSLFCDNHIAVRIYNESNDFKEKFDYIKIKNKFLSITREALDDIRREQLV
jgi:hypothetical protein